MRPRLSGSAPFLLGVLGLLAVTQPAVAQYPQTSPAKRFQSGWENDRVRVRTISVEPGARAVTQGDAVIVFLTADFQGRMPRTEAVWQPGGGELENRGIRRVEAVVIELKNAPATAVGVTPPEALPATGTIDARLLIDNPRVTVTKQRYSPSAHAVGPRHFHPQDAVIVYLRGAYTWPLSGGWGPDHVRRGDIDVLPANTFHAFGNAGSDPLEFLVIFQK